MAYEAGAYAGLDRPATFASGAVSAIYLHDRDHASWPPTCLSCDVNGDPVGLSFDADISDDGDYVVFSTDVAFVTTDTNGVMDVYEYNTVHNTLIRVSTDAIGGEALVASTSPEVGGYTLNDAVAYQQGDDVVVHYQGNRYVHDDVNLVELAPGGIGGMVVRSGGDLYHLWPIDTSHAPVLVSAGVDGPANAPAWGGSLDYYGGSVVFNTDADNLIIADTNDTTDVFLRYFDVNNPS